MASSKIPAGIDGLPTNTIPDDPQAFVSWFKSVGIKRWLANADVRNAVQGTGISITGTISTPATISVNSQLQSLFSQPYVLVGAPVAPAQLTGYRSIAVQATVLSLTDSGAESTITIGVAANGIGNPQIRQSVGASVVGNATGATANVADIVAGADNTVLVRAAGALSFSALPVAAIAQIANNTVLANISGSLGAPSATAISSLTANPSVSIGLTAVNGTAATFMTSDSAPALSQAIAPTWTGAHTFTPSAGLTKFNGLNGSGGYAVQIQGGTTAGDRGARISGGTSASDYALVLVNAANTTNLGLFYGDGSATLTKGLGVNGASAPTQVTGFGTPVGGAVVANYNITDAGGANSNTNKCVAEILNVLKAAGIIGA